MSCCKIEFCKIVCLIISLAGFKSTTAHSCNHKICSKLECEKISNSPIREYTSCSGDRAVLVESSKEQEIELELKLFKASDSKSNKEVYLA